MRGDLGGRIPELGSRNLQHPSIFGDGGFSSLIAAELVQKLVGNHLKRPGSSLNFCRRRIEALNKPPLRLVPQLSRRSESHLRIRANRESYSLSNAL